MAAGKVILLPYIIAYKLRALPASSMRARLAWFGFRGRPETEVRAAGRRFAETVLPDSVRPKTLETIRWHKARETS